MFRKQIIPKIVLVMVVLGMTIDTLLGPTVVSSVQWYLLAMMWLGTGIVVFARRIAKCLSSKK